MKTKCKVDSCERPSVKEGFCGWCFKKYKKGIYHSSGELTSSELIKISQKTLKQKNKEKKEKLKNLENKKAIIKDRLTIPLLKVLQDERPDCQRTFYCNALSFFTSEPVCFARMFIFKKHKECLKCHVHDDKLDLLNEFLKLKETGDGQE